jgi:hypothetical protein
MSSCWVSWCHLKTFFIRSNNVIYICISRGKSQYALYWKIDQKCTNARDSSSQVCWLRTITTLTSMRISWNWVSTKLLLFHWFFLNRHSRFTFSSYKMKTWFCWKLGETDQTLPSIAGMGEIVNMPIIYLRNYGIGFWNCGIDIDNYCIGFLKMYPECRDKMIKNWIFFIQTGAKLRLCSENWDSVWKSRWNQYFMYKIIPNL